MKILLANDDGIRSMGLAAIRKALLARGHEVFTVAPMRQQSGVSHAITVFEPLRMEKISEDGIGLYGTPADCVKLGLSDLAPWQPDMVISGINAGKNVGPDVFYSGTIGAAAEGAYSGLPAVALSHACWHPTEAGVWEIACHAAQFTEKIFAEYPRRGVIININYPDRPLAQCEGVAVCGQAPAVWQNSYQRCHDPRGWPYWWMTGELDRTRIPEDSDIALLEKGYITVTPLHFEHTAHDCMEQLRKFTA